MATALRSSPPPRALADWETDAVALVLPTAPMYVYNRNLAALELCYADLCRELARYESLRCFVPDAAHAEKMARLSGLAPEHFPLAAIPDIWIRDFAPIPVVGGGAGFRYAPPYTSRRLSRAVEAAAREALPAATAPVQRETVLLEGGNLVHNGAGLGIATARLFAANPGQPRTGIVERIRRALGLERLVIVPAEPEDRTGHVDGMLRFAGERVLLVNDYRGLPGYRRFLDRLERVLARELSGIERVVLPYTPSTAKCDGWYDAGGNYANFLLTRRRVYVPVYGLPQDVSAVRIFERLFPGRVSRIEAGPIARYGGSIHCITWNYAPRASGRATTAPPRRRPRRPLPSRSGARRAPRRPSPRP